VKPYDIALTEEQPGKVMVHRADCPDARRQAAQGLPVATMLGCEGPLPKDLPKHSCLERK
jgi:hypothetical protein